MIRMAFFFLHILAMRRMVCIRVKVHGPSPSGQIAKIISLGRTFLKMIKKYLNMIYGSSTVCVGENGMRRSEN